MAELFMEAPQWIINNMTAFVLPFILVLSLLVFIHEWGHYIVARWCGVRVEVFSIGFGKELFGFTDKANTRWKFCLIPLGGYVKMFGDMDPASAKKEAFVEEGDTKRPMTDEEKKVAFFSKSVGQRAAIVFAGPAINFLFAILAFTFVFSYQGKTVIPPIASVIVKDGAAYSQGLQPRDVIVNINGRPMERFQDIQRQVMISLDQDMDMIIVRDGDQLKRDIVNPEKVEFEDRHGFTQSRGMLGIMGPGTSFKLMDMTNIAGQDVTDLDFEARKAIFIENMDSVFEFTVIEELGGTTFLANPISAENEAFISGEVDFPVMQEMGEDTLKRYSLWGAFVESLRETEEVLSGTLDALGQMFTGVRSPTELGGIVRIGAVAGDAASMGIIALLSFAALLSINLGLLNLFPIPVLDGGHLVFYFVESIKGSPVSEKVQDYAFGAGMIFIVGLMLFANLNDLYQLLLS